MHSGHDHTLFQQLITIIFIVYQSISVANTQGSTVYNLMKQNKLHACSWQHMSSSKDDPWNEV